MPERPLPREAILIVNTRSRVGALAFDQAVDGLIRQGVELREAIAMDDPAQLNELVHEAVRKAPMVVVGGGDGTLSSAIDHFKGTETVFALLPLGTANSFARSLGIPLDLPGAIIVVAHGVRERIDLGCINGDYFGNSAAIGLSPMIAKSVPHKLKRYLGRAGYALWAARMGLTFRPFRLFIDDGVTRSELWASEVRIANGGFFGGVELVDQADLTSGEIIVQIVTGKSNRNLASSWFANMLRLKNRDQWQAEIHGKKLRLTTDPVLDVTIDGELSCKTPIDVWVAHRAVDVAVPRGVTRPG